MRVFNIEDRQEASKLAGIEAAQARQGSKNRCQTVKTLADGGLWLAALGATFVPNETIHNVAAAYFVARPTVIALAGAFVNFARDEISVARSGRRRV